MSSLTYDVLYTTDETVDQIESLLAARCKGDWRLEMRGGRRKRGPRNLRIIFEHESDISALLH
jgi:hypothetical protein